MARKTENRRIRRAVDERMRRWLVWFALATSGPRGLGVVLPHGEPQPCGLCELPAVASDRDACRHVIS
jgi:hypothetical protein